MEIEISKVIEFLFTAGLALFIVFSLKLFIESLNEPEDD